MISSSVKLGKFARRTQRTKLSTPSSTAAKVAGRHRGIKATGKYIDNSAGWRQWLKERFPRATEHPFADRHVRLWEWFEALTPGVRPRPRVDVWPRGGAKSSTAELGCVRIGTRIVEVNGEKRPARRFVLYVSETQDRANTHVQAVAGKLEDLNIGRAVGKYGHSKGWSVDLIRCETGFNVLALGLDAASRGVKLDDYRPDLIIFDDIDKRHEKPEQVQKKIETITESILPAGSSDCAILFVQNKIHKDGIVSQLADGRADFLLTREVPTVEAAVVGLEFEPTTGENGLTYYRITAGTPTWQGQSLETCEKQLNEWGRAAFLREAQQEVDDDENGLWDRKRDIEAHRISWSEMPDLIRVGVGVDPSATSTGDEAGVIVAGIAKVNDVIHGYVFDDKSVQGSPKVWASAAVDGYHQHGGDVLVAESNNGGEMVEITIGTIPNAPRVKLVHASRGKLTRAEPVQKLYEDGRVHHVGEFVALESEMCSWVPGEPSPNRLDAAVWILTDLMLKAEAPPAAQSTVVKKKFFS